MESMSKTKPNLLIVDDEPSNLQKLRRTFITDFEILPARTGEEALDLLNARRVHVIVTDQKMPGMNGVDLLKRSLEFSPEAIRVILTGYAEVEYLMDAINLGHVHRYVTKPWDPFTLRQTVLQTLEHFELKRQNRILAEQLRIAREVQTRLFPRTLFPIPGIEYSGVCHPAGDVGGDYYDFLPLGPDRLWLAVGDISGKGISAALLMASLQASMRSHVALRRDSMQQLVSDMNRQLWSLTDESKFASFFCGVYDSARRRLTYVNAGHNPPLLYAANSRPAGALKAERISGDSLEVRKLEANGLILGAFEDSVYGQESVEMRPGDTLIVYTDGIVDTCDSAGEPFGEGRLMSVVGAHRHLSAEALQYAILDEVGAYARGLPARDDRTLVVLKAL